MFLHDYTLQVAMSPTAADQDTAQALTMAAMLGTISEACAVACEGVYCSLADDPTLLARWADRSLPSDELADALYATITDLVLPLPAPARCEADWRSIPNRDDDGVTLTTYPRRTWDMLQQLRVADPGAALWVIERPGVTISGRRGWIRYRPTLAADWGLNEALLVHTAE